MIELLVKPAFPALFLLQICISGSAQLNIQKGAFICISNNQLITLQNADLLLNGTIQQQSGAAIFRFSGNGNNYIQGSRNIGFNNIQVAKTGTAFIGLKQDINISKSIGFISGILNLNGHHITMKDSAYLTGENNNSRITGNNGGYIQTLYNLTAPSAITPANLGLTITSSQNLGATIIRRGHTVQKNSNGQGSSVLRYYDILPTNNKNLNATIGIHYFDNELNGFNKDSLVLLESTDTLNWASKGVSVNNTSADYVAQNGIAGLARFTLSSASNVLHNSLTAFVAQYIKNTLVLSWTSSQEINSHHFEAQSSPDGYNWKTIGNITAAGQSSFINDYSYAIKSPATCQQLYRIVEFDNDGFAQYSAAIKAPCGEKELVLNMYPNPVKSVLTLSVVVSADKEIFVELFSAAGVLLNTQKYQLQAGNNQLSINVAGYASGMYKLVILDGNRLVLKTEKIVKVN